MYTTFLGSLGGLITSSDYRQCEGFKVSQGIAVLSGCLGVFFVDELLSLMFAGRIGVLWNSITGKIIQVTAPCDLYGTISS